MTNYGTQNSAKTITNRYKVKGSFLRKKITVLDESLLVLDEKEEEQEMLEVDQKETQTELYLEQ